MSAEIIGYGVGLPTVAAAIWMGIALPQGPANSRVYGQAQEPPAAPGPDAPDTPAREAPVPPPSQATEPPVAGATAPASGAWDEAKRDLERRRYRSALRKLVPCLRAEARPDLEECLYLGEHAAHGLYDSEIFKRGRDVEAAFKAVGLKLRKTYDGPALDHQFFRKLALLFPRSHYAEEFDYVLIEILDDRGSTYRDAWKPGEKRLLAYLEHFPHGTYAVRAELDLACIYEGLWDVLRPGNKDMDVYRPEFTSGSRKRDAALARRYRVKALAYYRRALEEARLHPDFITPYDPKDERIGYHNDLDDARKRLHDLPAGVPAYRICIFWD